ncbi:hypothetical protein C4B68_19035 [Streptomyces dengpaensis]|uniref:Uncharacterized protein n=1 Tax=Streptomyces dengpaensis TaxID=2049881 RepID=A0ABM6SS03_9ACTN|nr:hypothetical protein C4B68_19035 [Streptomyces dengpaensis]PIB04106.1 hypothetical protein B1C81_34330 [Streptomyces sp. HG99]
MAEPASSAKHPVSWNREAETGLNTGIRKVLAASTVLLRGRKEPVPARAADHRASRTASPGISHRNHPV